MGPTASHADPAASLMAGVFEHLPDAVSVTSPRGEIVRANPAFCAMVGYSEQELRRIDIAHLTHPEDLPLQRRLVHEVLAGQRPQYRMRKRYLRKDGGVVVGCVRSGPLRTREGKVTGLIGVTAPADDDLQEMAQRYRSLFDHNFDAVYSLDLQGRFTSVNSALQRITGYGPGELLGHSFQLYIETGQQAERQRMFERAAAGETVNYDTTARHKDGGLRHTNVTKMPIVVNGAVVGVYAIAKDITGRIRHEQELAELAASLEQRVRERTAELEAANQGLEAFAASASHDLRAPLGRIAGFAGALWQAMQPAAEPRALHYIDRILASTRNMEALIDGLLALARATRGEMRRETVDLSALAQEAAARLAEREPQRLVRLEVQAGIAATGDARLLGQVMENLLANAWKYTGTTPHAQVRFYRLHQDGQPVYCVADNGVGFDMAQAHRLFGAFQRLHSAGEFPGTGVGLATVHAIVLRHGGRVWAEAAPNRGARFYFTLP